MAGDRGVVSHDLGTRSASRSSMSCHGGSSTGNWARSRRSVSDEIQYAKGHKYLTLVYQIEQHCTRLLWIGRERDGGRASAQFFALIGEELAGRIEFVCSDMWQPLI